MIIGEPPLEQGTSRARVDAANHPGIRNRLAVGPDDAASDGDAPAKSDVRVLTFAGRLRFPRKERMGVRARTVRLPIKEQAFVDLVANKVVVWSARRQDSPLDSEQRARTIHRPRSGPGGSADR